MTRDVLAERCQGCGRYMRPIRIEANQYPGRVAYGGRGRCSTCYKALRNTERAKEGLPPIEKRGDRKKAAIRGRDGRRASITIYDRDLSQDEQRVLYMVLRRFRGEEQGQVAGMLGLTDGAESR